MKTHQKNPPKDDPMADAAVTAAMDALLDAIDEAFARRNLPPANACAIIVQAGKETDVQIWGCDCIACKTMMMSSFARAQGADFDLTEVEMIAEAARQVH